MQRVAQGGTKLAPPTPEWLLDLVEWGGKGAYNACAPAPTMTFGTFLDGCRSALDAEAEFVWTREDFLAQHGVAPWTEPPLWAGDDARGLNAVSNARAQSAGQQLRPLVQTVVDTLPLGRRRSRFGAGQHRPVGAQREAQRLRKWRRCSRR